MRIAIQMNHIKTINIERDTTFDLCLAAKKLGYKLFHYTIKDLSMCNNMPYAWMQELDVEDKISSYYKLYKAKKINLSDIDVILLRQDPPFNMNYITSTYILEKICNTTLVVNHPKSVRDNPEKILLSDFIDLMPETLITKSIKEIISFIKKYKKVIIKPLYMSGGSGIFCIKYNDKNLYSLLEMLETNYSEPYILQPYLSDVKFGDKRVILINGVPVGGILRIPPINDNRCNIHVGGIVKKMKLNNRDYEICERISPFLQRNKLIFVGIDIIGSYLTEINVTSPTGIREIKKLEGKDLSKIFWKNIDSILSK